MCEGLRKSSEIGDIDSVQSLLEAGADVCAYRPGVTPAHPRGADRATHLLSLTSIVIRRRSYDNCYDYANMLLRNMRITKRAHYNAPSLGILAKSSSNNWKSDFILNVLPERMAYSGLNSNDFRPHPISSVTSSPSSRGGL